jgi:hypothetical protein
MSVPNQPMKHNPTYAAQTCNLIKQFLKIVKASYCLLKYVLVEFVTVPIIALVVVFAFPRFGGPILM